MHEAAVAQSLLGVILKEIEGRQVKPIGALVSCGSLSGINEEMLSFAFEAIASETACRDCHLRVEYKPLEGCCVACGSRFDIDLRPGGEAAVGSSCPACGSVDFELLPDAPLVLERIECEEG